MKGALRYGTRDSDICRSSVPAAHEKHICIFVFQKRPSRKSVNENLMPISTVFMSVSTQSKISSIISKASSRISLQRDFRRLIFFFLSFRGGCARSKEGRTNSRSPCALRGIIFKSCSGAPQLEHASSCRLLPCNTRAARVPQ